MSIRLRDDGRNCNELRQISSEQGTLHRADGSSNLTFGDTTVLVAVYGPGQAKIARNELVDKAAIDVCVRLNQGIAAAKEKEMELIVRRLYEPIIQRQEFPRTVISIVIQIIEDAGSISSLLTSHTIGFGSCVEFLDRLCLYLVSAVINAVTMALMDAEIAMLGVVTSTTCCLTEDGSVLLDPSQKEEAECISLVICASSFQLAEGGVLFLSSEGPLSEEQLFSCAEACKRGSKCVETFIRQSYSKRLEQSI
uniref:Uncharacterized protein AlNc14C28G2677 n=1 Tax=Albugo laibachii Nc14 TaxID=890382 RepID=F0W748_9STRA|nr:conserved hypothetical protein [Albugo laibachii Nc14]|eukprot:CCA16947.1 conserved hypothetical protein [Albugo laibachii Nc14]